MIESAVQTRAVQLQSGGIQVEAYLAEPSAAGQYPGVVVLQEIFGVNEHIRDVTERLANEGYVAIAPALYQRQAPGFETGYTPDDIKLGRQYKEKTRAEELLSDVQAAVDYLKQLPNVAAAKGFGCIGFCFGGHVAYLAATLADIQATASFYGAGLTTWCPGGEGATIDRTAQIAPGTLHAFFGMDDASIPVEQVEQIEATLQQFDIPHRVWRYAGADHGFFCDRRNSYNAAAAADAWQKVQDLFQQTLGS